MLRRLREEWYRQCVQMKEALSVEFIPELVRLIMSYMVTTCGQSDEDRTAHIRLIF